MFSARERKGKKGPWKKIIELGVIWYFQAFRKVTYKLQG